MKTIAPDYYSRFRCTADECRHSCCIGWEIGIDSDSLDKYSSAGGEFGKRLRSSIDFKNSCFILDEKDRCPFLNRNGLCDIITHMGEENICEICTDHPRFRNFFETRTEIGLGLTCEAAAKLIIENPNKVHLTVIDDDEADEETEEEKYALEIRDEAIAVLQNSRISPYERIADILELSGAELPSKTPAEWAGIFSSLERLAPEWDYYIDLLSRADELSLIDGMEFQQLAVYFAYRHISQSYEDERFEAHTAFAALSTYIICTIFNQTGTGDIEELENIARLYSGETEYSEENLSLLKDILSE